MVIGKVKSTELANVFGIGPVLGNYQAILDLVMYNEAGLVNHSGAKDIMQRVMSAWNALPEEVAEVDTMAVFKKHLDEYMNRKEIEGYGS
eukprot:g30897.t1